MNKQAENTACVASPPADSRIKLWDWLKGLAIIAVVFDHFSIVPEHFVIWSVNIFVLVTAATYSEPKYFFSVQKLVLKIFQLVYLVTVGVFFFKALHSIFELPTLYKIQTNQSLATIFLSPFKLFVRNPYLGDIWYVGLHIQFLFVLFIGLRSGILIKPKWIWSIAIPVSLLSFFATHFVFHRFDTILFSSWLIFLSAGFYGMRPLLRAVETTHHNRWIVLSLALGLLVALFALYPHMPWAFTNSNRSSFITLPFYFCLLVFFCEAFHLMKNLRHLKFVKAFIILLGRHTLAIYLTHEPFAQIWKVYFSSPIIFMPLSVGCGILFGIATKAFFNPFQNWIKNIGKKTLAETAKQA